MNPNSQNSLQKTPENNASLSLIGKKNTAKKPWKFYIFPAFVLVIAIWYGGYFRLFASGIFTPMAPNTVLDPACAPTDTGCYVQITPVASTSTAGQILSNDGTNTTWVNETGGIFPYAANPVTRANWTGVSSSTIGTATTTLADFIKNVFFPNGIVSYQVVATSSSATTYTAPGLTFALVGSGGSTAPTCTGTTSLVCEKIDSSHNNLTANIVTTAGNATPNTLQHLWAVWSDGSTSTTATYGVKTTTSGNWNLALDRIVAGTPTTDPISNVSLKTGVSTSPFCGFTNTGSFTSMTVSPCSLSLVGSGQTIHPSTVVDSTNGGAATTFFVQDTGNGGTTSANVAVTFASRSYIFVSSTNYHTATSSLTGSVLFTKGGTCESPATSGCSNALNQARAQTVTLQGLSNQYVYYAYPQSLGAISGYNTGTIFDCGGGTLCSPASDSSWVQDSITVTNTHGGYSEPYYLYSYQWNGATLDSISGIWRFQFP